MRRAGLVLSNHPAGHSGPGGLALRFWETLSKVSVSHMDDGSAESEIL